MRAKEFLREYSRDITAQNYRQKLIAAAMKDNTLPKKENPEDRTFWESELLNYILTQLEHADPTPHKQYVQWLAKIYSQGQTKFEDILSKAKDYLTKFEKLKNKNILPANNLRDINTYKNLTSLHYTLSAYPIPEEEIVDKGQAGEFYNDAQIRIIVPLDEQAAKYYGQGTQWCTAAKNNNMFDRYNKEGRMFIIIPKKPAHPGEKYQFHFESEQYMTETDEPVNLDRLSDYWPQLSKIFYKEALRNVCIPLLPNKQEISNNWNEILEQVTMSLYRTIPIEKILSLTTKELIKEVTGDQYLVKEIVEDLRSDIANDLGGLFDMFVQTLTPGRLVASGVEDMPLFESIVDGIADWLGSKTAGQRIDDAEKSDPKIDAFGATFVIANEIYESIWPLIKQEIRNQISK